jgi:hypothetical protein
MVNFGDGGDSGLSAAARNSLLDCHARRQSGDQVDFGLLELLHELPRIGGHAVEESAAAPPRKECRTPVSISRIRSDR